MATKKISELTAGTAFAAADEFVFVDKSDTSSAASGTTKKATLDTLLKSLPSGTMVCIGGGTAAAAFHAFGTNPELRLEEVTGSYGSIIDVNAQTLQLNKTAASGQPFIDISPLASDGTSASAVRLFRNTNTTGASTFVINPGDNTSNVAHSLAGSGAANLCQLAGNLAVGVVGTNNASITAAGNVTGANRTANGGNARNTLAPNATAHVDAQVVGSTNYDITLPEDGYYIFSVLVFVQLATALTYRRVGATIDGSRASGTLTVEGSQEPINGGNGTGLTLTLSETSGNLRCALNNATGEAINGHINVYWGLTDLPS